LRVFRFEIERGDSMSVIVQALYFGTKECKVWTRVYIGDTIR